MIKLLIRKILQQTKSIKARQEEIDISQVNLEMVHIHDVTINYDYLTERYNYYFNNSDLDTNYDVFLDNFTYDGSYDEFITVYNDDYGQLKRNLEAFKSDLENNVIKGNDEVDKYNQEMITATDKAIIAVDDYIGSFGEKAKDYATLSKDEVVKGLRSLTLDAHNARLDLKNLYDDAKDKLGIK